MSQRIIGLTGGIGTGKSTVAAILRDQGIPVLDADHYARQAVNPGSVILTEIIDHFGRNILDSEGQLNRKALGQRIFADPIERRWLEARIHPYVREQMTCHQRLWSDQPVLCLMIPLLFEANLTTLVTEIWVIRCDLELQIQRLKQRDSLSIEAIQARIASQWPLEEKVKRADVVLDNSGSLLSLKQQVLSALQVNLCA